MESPDVEHQKQTQQQATFQLHMDDLAIISYTETDHALATLPNIPIVR